MPWRLSILVFLARILLYLCYPPILVGNGIGWLLERVGLENATKPLVHIAVVMWLVFLVALAVKFC